MKLLLLTAVIAAVCACAPATAQNWPFESVATLQEITVETGQDGVQTPALVNVCGAVSINQKDHLWLTAYHCIDGVENSYLRGEKVSAVVKDVLNDLAIVKTVTIQAPAVKLAAVEPKVGDTLYTIASPMGITPQLLLQGPVVNAAVDYDHPYIWFQVPVAPGASGAPVFNSDMELVSVVQRGFSPHSYSPLGAGVTYAKVAALAYWWEKQ